MPDSILKLRKLLGTEQKPLSQGKLARRLNLEPAAVSQWEQKKKQPGTDSWIALARLARGNAELSTFFLSRAGFAGDEPARIAAALAGQPRINIVTREEWRKGLADHLGRTIIEVPVVADRAAAGNPLHITEADIDTVVQVPARWAPRGPGYYTGIRIRGDSMEETLHEDDIVCVEHSDVPPEPKRLRGKIVAAIPEEGGGVVIKRLGAVAESGLILVSDNNEYAPIIIRDPSWRVLIGPVVWVFARQRL